LRRFISTGNELRTPVTKDEIVSEVPFKLKKFPLYCSKTSVTHALIYFTYRWQGN
jgi:hypothetical protein